MIWFTTRNRIMALSYKKGIDKRTALLKATLRSLSTVVFRASMAKIAKEASISPATILSFLVANKLLNQLYLSVKSNLLMLHLVHMRQGIPKQFETIWHNMAQYKLAHQRKHHFVAM
jgi:hypothetical protein